MLRTQRSARGAVCAVGACADVDPPLQHLNAISETIISPIKQQEPGHFAFCQMSATAMVQDRMLKPWQLFLTRVLREKSYNLVGTNAMRQFKADMGGVLVNLGIDQDVSGYAREIGRVEPAALGGQAGAGVPAVHRQGPARERPPLPGADRARPQARLTAGRV